MGAAQATYGQAGLPAGAPAVELVAVITQPLKNPSSLSLPLPHSYSLAHANSAQFQKQDICLFDINTSLKNFILIKICSTNDLVSDQSDQILD